MGICASEYKRAPKMMWGLEAKASKQKLVSESEKREEQRAKRQKERGRARLPKGKGREQRMRRGMRMRVRGCKVGKRCKLAAERSEMARMAKRNGKAKMRSKALQGPSRFRTAAAVSGKV